MINIKELQKKYKNVLIFEDRVYRKMDRPFIRAIPIEKIYEIKTKGGSENVYCEINGIETNLTFEEVLEIFK